MKRLTDKRLALPPGVWQEVTREQRMEMQEIPVPSKQELYYRLFQIEEILRDGEDEYDLDRLRELVEADRDGRCVVLPCKPGDTVWRIVNDATPHITKDQCLTIMLDNGSMWVDLINDGMNGLYFGQRLFRTREEAEEALKAREQDG